MPCVIDFVGRVIGATDYAETPIPWSCTCHWGKNGTTIADHDSGGTEDCGPEFSPSDATLMPLIAVVSLGFNDCNAGNASSAYTRLTSLVAYIRSLAPTIRLVLATCAATANAGAQVYHDTVDAAIRQVVDETDDCVLSDVAAAAWNTSVDLGPGGHPTATGYALMATCNDLAIRRAAGYADNPLGLTPLQGVVEVVCIGDSITNGVNDSSPSDGWAGGWRHYLWRDHFGGAIIVD